MIEHKTRLYQTKDFILYELSTHLISFKVYNIYSCIIIEAMSNKDKPNTTNQPKSNKKAQKAAKQ